MSDDKEVIAMPYGNGGTTCIPGYMQQPGVTRIRSSHAKALAFAVLW